MTSRRSPYNMLQVVILALFACAMLSACSPLSLASSPRLGSTAAPTVLPPAGSPGETGRDLARTNPEAAPVVFEPGDYRIAREIAYAHISGVDPGLLSLDVYYPAAADASRPVMLYIHGGGWTGGDKVVVGDKPGFFTGAGFVFISTNYRLSPEAHFPAHARDVAAAIAWTTKTVRQYGGDPNQIYLMGHSAGGHLATLVASDDQFLKELGFDLSVIKGVVSLDTAAYDLAEFASRCKNRTLPEPYSIPFGQNPEEWKLASPVTYIRPGRRIPPMAVIYSGDVGVNSGVPREQLAAEFSRQLSAAGVANDLFGDQAKNHSQINDTFGQAGDKVALRTLAFLQKIQARSR